MFKVRCSPWPQPKTHEELKFNSDIKLHMTKLLRIVPISKIWSLKTVSECCFYLRPRELHYILWILILFFCFVLKEKRKGHNWSKPKWRKPMSVQRKRKQTEGLVQLLCLLRCCPLHTWGLVSCWAMIVCVYVCVCCIHTGTYGCTYLPPTCVGLRRSVKYPALSFSTIFPW